MKTVRTLKEATIIINEAGLDLSTITSVQDFCTKVVTTLSTDPVKMASLLGLVKVMQRHFAPKPANAATSPLGKLNSRIVNILKKENMTLALFIEHVNNMTDEVKVRIEKVAKKPIRSKKLPTPPVDNNSMQP
jgi:hypothetical protein